MALQPPKIRRDEFLDRVQRDGVELEVGHAATDSALEGLDVRDLDDGDGVLRGEELGALYDQIEDRLDGGSPRAIRSPRGREAIGAVFRRGTTSLQRASRAMRDDMAARARDELEGTQQARQRSIMEATRQRLETDTVEMQLLELRREEAFIRRDLEVLDALAPDAGADEVYARLNATWEPRLRALGFGERYGGTSESHLRDPRHYFSPELAETIHAYLGEHPNLRLNPADAAAFIVYEGLTDMPMSERWVSSYSALGADFAGSNANALVRAGFLDRSWSFSPRALSDFMARSGFDPVAHARSIPDGENYDAVQRAYFERFEPELERYGWSIPDRPWLYDEVQVNPHFAVRADNYKDFGQADAGFHNEQERAYPVEFRTAAEGVHYVTAELAHRQEEHLVRAGLGALSDMLAEAGQGRFSPDELFDTLSPNAQAFWTYACYAYPNTAELLMPQIARAHLEAGGDFDAVMDGFDPERLAEEPARGIFARAGRPGTLAISASRAGMSEVVRLLPSEFGPGRVAEAREALATIEARRTELEARLAELRAE